MPNEKDLFANFERMRREIDELFGDVFGRSALVRQSGFVPHIDVAYIGDPPVSVVIQAELAGVDPSRVALEIRGRRLIIAGERHCTDAAGCFYQQVEIEHGPFRREIELGTGMPKNIAAMSTKYVPSSSGRRRAYWRPSRIPRKLGRFASGGGGTARIRMSTRSEKA